MIGLLEHDLQMPTSIPDNVSAERFLSREILGVVEAAAIAAGRFMGKGDPIAVDAAATQAMREQLNRIPMNGQVVIGEGERDQAPMLYIGEQLGRTDIGAPETEAETLAAARRLHEAGCVPVPHLAARRIASRDALERRVGRLAEEAGVMDVLVIGGGGAAYPLDVGGVLADIIAAPDIDVFRSQDIRATIGATVEGVAPRDQEPEVWEDYVSAYEGGRFAESTRFVRSYPEQLPLLAALLPDVSVPVHVVYGAHDPLVPPSNGRYLAQRLPAARLTILDAAHFGWEEAPQQYAAIIKDTIDRAAAMPKLTGD